MRIRALVVDPRGALAPVFEAMADPRIDVTVTPAGAPSPSPYDIVVVGEGAEDALAAARAAGTPVLFLGRAPSPDADQSFPLPGHPDVLRTYVLATAVLGGRIDPARVASLADGSTRLPGLPGPYVALRAELDRPEPSLPRLGEAAGADPAVTVRLLSTVNSAAYGLRREVSDLTQAITLLGVPAFESLILAVGLFEDARRLDRRLAEVLWRDAVEVAATARAFAVGAGLPPAAVEQARLAGLLHDVGKIVLLANSPDRFVVASLLDDERRLFGATHADLGGYLGATWNLARGVVDAIAHHHDPPGRRGDPSTITPLTLVHAARAVVDNGGRFEGADIDVPDRALFEGLASTLGAPREDGALRP